MIQILILTLLTVLLATQASATWTQGTTGSLIYYTHDDDDTSGTTSIDSAGNYNGTLTNGVTSGVAGIINEAYDFNSADSEYVDTGLTTWYDEMTFSLWFKTTSNTWYITSFRESGSKMFNIELGGIGTSNVMYLKTDGVDPQYQYNLTSLNLDDNAWHHLVVILDMDKSSGDVFYLYVDAVNITPFTKATAVNSFTSSTQALYLGARNQAGTDDQHYDGVIDEFAVFNRSLSADEIAYLYNSGSPDADQQYPFSSGAPAEIINTTQSIILPLNPYNNDTLKGYCNGTRTGAGNITYYYEWYKNNVSYSTGNATGLNATLTNVANITSTSLWPGQNWTLQCTASDGASNNATALNSTTITILELPGGSSGGFPYVAPIPGTKTILPGNFWAKIQEHMYFEIILFLTVAFLAYTFKIDDKKRGTKL